MFNTIIQQVQYNDKYAKWNNDLGRRETWPETVNRVVDYLDKTLKNHCDRYTPLAINSVDWVGIREGMLNLEVMPSMRLVQMAGPAIDRCNVGAYNCAYLPLKDWRSLGELLYILMQGTGVGFSVESQYTDQFPIIKPPINGFTGKYVITDSTEGWCNAFEYGLLTWESGQDVEFDYSDIRPYGAVLKTKGGKSSGPEPLKNLLDYSRKMLRNHGGRKLSSLNIHDLACYCGSIVQVGGVRRAAEISLSDLDDVKLRHAKDGNFYSIAPERAMSNNSAVYDEKPSMQLFMQEWTALMLSGSGERGIFNRGDVNSQIPTRRTKSDEFGLNPCFAKGTLIETVNGRIPIEDITTNTWVYTMEQDETLGIRRASSSWKNKKSSTLAIQVGNYILNVTPDHQIYTVNDGWKSASLLAVGEEVVAIQRVRRGAAYCGVKLSSEVDYQMEHRFVWEKLYGPLPANWDVHHEDNDTYNNKLVNLRALPHNHHAYVTAITQTNTHQIKGNSGKFVTHTESRQGAKTIVPLPAELKSGLHQYAVIKSITEGPEIDVYDLKVEGTHNVIANGIVAHNCGEIILRPYQFCNLSVCVVRPNDTMIDLRRKIGLAAQIGVIQSLLTKFNYIRPDWQKNCEEERLLGVDITGQLDNKIFIDYAAGAFQDLQLVAQKVAFDLATQLNINRPAAITCVKPSGNSSQLLDCASGLHPRFAKHYIRRLRIGANSPIVPILRDARVPLFPEVGQPPDNPSIWVAEFPVKSPKGAVTRSSWGAMQQLDYWLRCKRHYTEHNPSCTIYVKEDEWLKVGAWVYENWKHIGGLSFLPYSGGNYQLAPYEECTVEEYNQRLSSINELNWENLRLYEQTDLTEGNREFSCVGDKCEL